MPADAIDRDRQVRGAAVARVDQLLLADLDVQVAVPVGARDDVHGVRRVRLDRDALRDAEELVEADVAHMRRGDDEEPLPVATSDAVAALHGVVGRFVQRRRGEAAEALPEQPVGRAVQPPDAFGPVMLAAAEVLAAAREAAAHVGADREHRDRGEHARGESDRRELVAASLRPDRRPQPRRREREHDEAGEHHRAVVERRRAAPEARDVGRGGREPQPARDDVRRRRPQRRPVGVHDRRCRGERRDREHDIRSLRQHGRDERAADGEHDGGHDRRDAGAQVEPAQRRVGGDRGGDDHERREHRTIAAGAEHDEAADGDDGRERQRLREHEPRSRRARTTPAGARRARRASRATAARPRRRRARTSRDRRRRRARAPRPRARTGRGSHAASPRGSRTGSSARGSRRARRRRRASPRTRR